MAEVWKNIPGYEGLYEVSDMGRVRSLNRYIPSRNRHGIFLRFHQGRILMPTHNKDGYPCVDLCNCGARISKKVGSLVAFAFIGPRPKQYQLCHNDGNPKNNLLSNLRYDTIIANQADKRLHGTHCQGEDMGLAKLTDADVIQMRKLKSKYTHRALAEMYGLAYGNVGRIIRRETWKHIP